VFALFGGPQVSAQAAGDPCKDARLNLVATNRALAAQLRRLKISRDQFNTIFGTTGEATKKQNETFNMLKSPNDCAAIAKDYCDWFNGKYGQYGVSCAS
jgi:hypothetical protein